jgi:hypothetical protein
MPLLQVYSTSGQARREILIPGRSAMRQFGAIQIVNNVGQRQESDWAAVKAALAAGSVVICLSGYESDVLPQYLQGTLPYGGNVRFESRKNLHWRLVEDHDGAYVHVEQFEYECPHCDADFHDALTMGRHIKHQHPDIVHRLQAAGA